MSGSRLGRGRGGRLAVYGACGVVVVLLVFLYRAATTEMSRLREIHVQCAHQQEALAAQLQVIFEYKVRLEKSLAEEKSSNAAVKQELQQRASREKSLRDKDSVEALQRFNSLQQNHKLLQTENQDLKEDCEKQQKQALDDRKRLEVTLRELRSQLREAREDKEKSMEHLKTKFLELDTDKTRLEEKYNALLKSNGNTDSEIEHLRKEVMQLNRELKEAEHSCKATSPGPSMISHRSDDHQLAQPNVANVAVQGASVDEQQRIRPSSQQQVSRPSNDVNAIPHPIQAPRDHQPIRNTNEDNKNDDNPATEKPSIIDVRFVKRDGNIVPAGPEEFDAGQRDSFKASIPLPYAYREQNIDDNRRIVAKNRKDTRVENVGDAPPKPVLLPPQSRNIESSSSSSPSPSKSYEKKSLSKDSMAHVANIRKPEDVENSQIRPEERQPEDNVLPSGFDEIRDIQKKVAGILNNND